MALPQSIIEKAIGTNSPDTVPEIISKVFRTSSAGPLDDAIGNNFYGINHRQTPAAIQINKDYYGLTFFTRPDLNLSDVNLRTVRQFTPLLNLESKSIQRIIRCLLSPRMATDSPAVTSPFVDPTMAFIPVLTNSLLSMSGWPDLNAPTYTSPEGIYKEAFSMIDGIVQNYETFEITANFRNLPGDPITLMFMTWLHYASRTYLGEMVPYPDKIVRNEYDYNTRIYRIILDPSKRFIQKIGACGAAFPTSCPIGAAFNFEAERPLNQGMDQISITFRAMGAMYNDFILYDEFNRTVQDFCPAMHPKYRKDYFKKVELAALPLFNNRGQPHLNLATSELEWYVTIEEWNQRFPEYQKQVSMSPFKSKLTG
jgi:hypothetical protein